MIGSSLADAIFWVAVCCILMAQIAIVRSVFRARYTSAPGAARSSRGRELAWVLLPAAGLAVMLAFTWRALHPPPEADVRPDGGAGVVSAAAPTLANPVALAGRAAYAPSPAPETA
ncbi:MAG: hypothetical protein ACRENI_03450 [Gemmatimonadaceae bacterium]